LCILKNSNDKIIGGFADREWNTTTGGPTERGFLFSVTLKEKYPNKEGTKNQTPLGGTTGYLMLWGWGSNDLAIYENCNTNTSSYTSTFGHYYDNKGRTK